MTNEDRTTQPMDCWKAEFCNWERFGDLQIKVSKARERRQNKDICKGGRMKILSGLRRASCLPNFMPATE